MFVTPGMRDIDQATARGTPSTHSCCSHLRVRYAETDRMGVVYYANYLVWFEIGRTDWLRSAGFTYRRLEESGVILPVIDTRCEYRQSARYDDEIEVRTRATLLSPVRVRFDYDVVRRAEGAVAAHGYTVHAAVDPRGRPTPLPDGVRRLFS